MVSLESGEKNPLPQLEAPVATPTPATPLPSEDEQTHDGDAWDPNSSVVSNAEVPNWLADEAFHGIRVKFQYRTQLLSPFLKFGGMEDAPFERYPGFMTKIVDAAPSDDNALVIIEPTHIITHLTTFQRPEGTYSIQQKTLVICWALNRGRR